MKWYDYVSLCGIVLTLIGAVVFLSIAPLERNSPGLPILVLGIVVMTYCYALRFFN